MASFGSRPVLPCMGTAGLRATASPVSRCGMHTPPAMVVICNARLVCAYVCVILCDSPTGASNSRTVQSPTLALYRHSLLFTLFALDNSRDQGDRAGFHDDGLGGGAAWLPWCKRPSQELCNLHGKLRTLETRKRSIRRGKLNRKKRS